MAADKSKHRKAALKAWDTIRKQRQEKAAKHTLKIDSFISVEKIGKIEHPETVKQELRDKWQGNGVVKLFNKTPEDIMCGPFWELRWAYGCPLNCSYCYLRGTMRGNMKQSYVKIDEIKRCVNEAFQKIETPSIFNTGELCDSLMNPELMSQIIDLFETQNKHKIYLLSKFGVKNIGFLIEKHRKNTICGWSINSEQVANLWESGAAKPKDRISAASQVWNKGYDTRIRIDPIFPIEGWKTYYSSLIDNIFDNLFPNRIILGTPRGLWKTISYAEKSGVDMKWANYFKETSGWGKKLPLDDRVSIYNYMIDELKKHEYPLSKISVCKETDTLLKSLELEYYPGRCNCYGRE